MSEKILIVDDSATARTLFKICLSAYPEYTVLEAGDWKNALDIAKNEKLALIVLDYNMPEKVGTELATLMQSEGVTGPFALMSANTQDHIIEETQALGFIHVLEKPISAEALCELLDKIA